MKSLSPETVEKYRQVWVLRLAGMSFEDIAKNVGYADKSGAKRAFDAASERWVVESVEQQRQIQSDRLDRLLFPAFQRVVDGDLAMIDPCLRIEKRRAELWGLDAPKRAEVTGANGEAIEINFADQILAKVESIEKQQQPNQTE